MMSEKQVINTIKREYIKQYVRDDHPLANTLWIKSVTYYDSTYHTVSYSCGESYLQNHLFGLPITSIGTSIEYYIEPSAIISKTCSLCGVTIL